MKYSRDPDVSRPFITLTDDTTPRYWSNCESKISACSAASASPRRRRDPLGDRVQQFGDAVAGLGGDLEDVLGGDAEHRLDLHRVAVGVGRREVDLVEAGDDLEIVLHREIAVGERLGLDALGGVDHEHDTLACGQRAAHLVAEVDVTGRVDQVVHVPVPVDADVLGLDRDAALALEIHRVEILRLHVAGFDRAR